MSMYNHKFILENIEPQIKESRIREQAKEVLLDLIEQVAKDILNNYPDIDKDKIPEKIRGDYSGKI